MRRQATLAATALLLLAGGALWASRRLREQRLRRECAAQTEALDLRLRSGMPRVYEGLRRSELALKSRRCVAILEYHYRDCDAAERRAAPAACLGPDAEIAAYDVARARLLFGCQRNGPDTLCRRQTYGRDGRLGVLQDIAPAEFPRLRTALVGK